MASVNYEEIFNYFLGNVTAYEFADMSLSDSYELCTEYLHKTVSDPYVHTLFSSVDLDDSINVFTYESDITDTDFILNILSTGMTIQWLKPKVRSVLNTAQFFGGKEQKFYSQSNHLSELRGLLEDAEIELRRKIMDQGYINNSYLEKKDGV